MATGHTKPVRGVIGIGLLTMRDAVPEVAIRILHAVGRLVRQIPAAAVQIKTGANRSVPQVLNRIAGIVGHTGASDERHEALPAAGEVQNTRDLRTIVLRTKLHPSNISKRKCPLHNQRRRMKTALVLSAGGMFGAYQAGAFRAISRMAPPDLVVGTSVGALNGWLIAGGCSPEDLIDRWLDPSAGETLTLFPNAGWGRGWFDPAPLRRQAEKIWSASKPAIPFGVVVTELPRLHARVIEPPNVMPAHLHASCSIPLFLPTVVIDGKRYLDGGIFEKLPIWAAMQMGATRIIAIDSLPNVGKWWLHLGISLAHAFKPRRRYPPDLDITIISPSGTLGDANDAVFWKRGNIERWIEMGERDAGQALQYAGSARAVVG